METNDESHSIQVSEPTPFADATKRWQAFYATAIEDAAKWAASYALIRAIPEAMPDALLIVDGKGEIVLVNSEFELMFGYHRSEVLGQTPEMLLPADMREAHVDHRRDYTNSPHARAMGIGRTLYGRRKTGADIPVRVMLGPVTTTDGIYTIAVIRRADESVRYGALDAGPG